MGAVILLVVLAYLAVLIGAPMIGYRLAARSGWQKSRRRLVALIVFLAIFLPMFWDWLPTVWLHSYYCEKYGGLTVTRTPEQWKEANPGIAETIARAKEPVQTGHWPKYSVKLSDRFSVDTEAREKTFSLRETEQRVLDDKTGEVLVRLVDFSTGRTVRGFNHFRDVKIWMHRNSCEEGEFKRQRHFSALSQAFGNLREHK
jgi:hypothetical protein